MKKLFILFVLFLGVIASTYSQVTATSANNKAVSNLVQQYLVGPNIELVVDANHPATFNEKSIVNSNQIGIFSNNNTSGCNIPMDQGLVIATCSYNEAASGGYGSSPSPSSSLSDFSDSAGVVFQWTYTKYCIENSQDIQDLNDIAFLSFWIKPTIDNFQFSYCFASNEYPQYVNASYNDFFGFYFSGPYDSVGNYLPGSPSYYMQNLALIPGTQTSVMINTVNHGKGSSHTPPHSYPEYHIVPTGNCSSSSGFNEWTVKLPTAATVVVAGGYYKISVLICDVSDHAFDSGLFISKDMRRFDTVNIDTTICENQDYYCTAINEYLTEQGKYQFKLVNKTGGDSVINIDLHINPIALVNSCWKLKGGESLEIDGNVITAPGTYMYKYKTYLGCDSTVVYNVEWGEETMEVDCVSGIEDIPYSDNVKVYPNPANDILRIEGLSSHTAIIEFYDNNGRLVKSVNFSDGQEISIRDLASGIYYIKINSNKNIINKRLIKK